MTIPAGCAATLTFYLHIDSAETTTSTQYDKLTVKAGSTTLATYSNLNKASGYTLRVVQRLLVRGADGDDQLHRHRGQLAADVVRHRRHGADAQLTPGPR